MGNTTDRFARFKNVQLGATRAQSIAMPKEGERWKYVLALEELEMRVGAKDRKEFVRATVRVLESTCPEDGEGSSRSFFLYSDKPAYDEMVARLIKSLNGGVLEDAAFETFLAYNLDGSSEDPKKGAGAIFRLNVEGRAAKSSGNTYRMLMFSAPDDSLYAKHEAVVAGMVA